MGTAQKMVRIPPGSFTLLALAFATAIVSNGADAAPVAEDTLTQLRGDNFAITKAISVLQRNGDALGEALQVLHKLPVDPNASKEQLLAREKVVKAELKKLAENPVFKEAGEDPRKMSMDALKNKESSIKDKIKELSAKKGGRGGGGTTTQKTTADKVAK